MDMDSRPVRGLLFRGSVDLEWFAAWCGVSLRTVHAWRAALAPPGYAVALAEVAAGALPWPAWSGWHARQGALYAPGARDGATPGEVAALPLLTAQLRAHERERGEPAQYCFCRQLSGAACEGSRSSP